MVRNGKPVVQSGEFFQLTRRKRHGERHKSPLKMTKTPKIIFLVVNKKFFGINIASDSHEIRGFFCIKINLFLRVFDQSVDNIVYSLSFSCRELLKFCCHFR